MARFMLSIDRPSFPATVPARLEHKTGGFAAGILLCSLCLQRFAVPVGANGVDVVFPIVFLIAAVAVLQGVFTFHRGRTRLYILFAAWLFIDGLVQAVAPNSYAVAYSLPSVMQFLLLTGFCTLSFSVPVAEMRFLRGAANILLLIAIAGIVQFVAQFAGLSLFSFSTIVPAKFLFETSYNVVIPAGIGELMKSNGFFLLEPSIFSQAMAMGLILEVLSFCRLTVIAVLTLALLLSFSGTGWIVIACFLLVLGLTQGPRGLVIALTATLVLLLLVFTIVFFAPGVAEVFASRLDEINNVGTSGYLRFVTPFMLLHTVLSHNGWAWLTGIGAGVAERIDLPFFFGVNTPVKIVVEYGIPGLFLYILLILRAERTRIQRTLVLPTLALLFATGGYQEFAPILFPAFLLICIARFE